MTEAVYTEGQTVALTFEVPKFMGEVITASSISYSVLDQDGLFILEDEDYTGYTVGDTEISINIEAQHNLLGSEAVIVRLVKVSFQTTASGVFTAIRRYLVQNSRRLEFLKNSFLSYERALIMRGELTDVPGWDDADEDQRIAALMQAHENICRFKFKYRPETENPVASQATLNDRGTYTFVRDMRIIDQENWDDFTPHFQLSLRRAQLVEADSLLAGDPIRDKREEGIISETVGESKMFFNNRPPLKLGVCRDALNYLKKYIFFRTKVLR